MGKFVFLAIFTASAALLGAGLLYTFETQPNSQSKFIPATSHLLFSKWKAVVGKLHLTPAENRFRLKNFHDSINKLVRYRRTNPDGIYGLSVFAD